MQPGLWASSLVRRDLPAGVTLDQAIEWTRTHLEGQRLLLASIAFLAWDWVITFDAEQEFIWQKTPWSVTKVLFVVNRYFPIVHSIARFYSYTHEHDPQNSELGCGPILDIAAYGSVITVAVVEIVLMLRLWAMYSRGKIIGFFLIFVFLAGFGTALAIRSVEPPDSFKLVHEAPFALTICKRSSPSELFFLYSIVLLVETMTFGLLLWKVWQLSAVGIAPILKTMLRHGTQYYLVVFLALFLQVLGTILQPLWQPLADALPVVAIASVACNRLVLSLRGMYGAPKQMTTIQDFHARSVTGNPTNNTRPIRLSVLRSPGSSNVFAQTLSFDDERTTFDRSDQITRDRSTAPSPIHEVDEGSHCSDHDDTDTRAYFTPTENDQGFDRDPFATRKSPSSPPPRERTDSSRGLLQIPF